MATVLISEESNAQAEELVRQGYFESVGQALEAGLRHLTEPAVDEDDEIDPDAEADALTDVSEEDREAIREGLRDCKEGRVLTIDQVFDPLIARLRAMVEHRPTGTSG